MWEGLVERRKQVRFLSGFENRGKGGEIERKKRENEGKKEKKINGKKKKW